MRKPTPSDIPFIKDSWLRSFERSWHVKRVPPATYRYNHGRLVDRLLVRSTTLVACDPADPWVVWGWICGEWDSGVLCAHYTYVKEGLRGYRVATKLYESLCEGRTPDAVVYTHDSKAALPFSKGLEEQGVLDVPVLYNPYLMYEE